MKEAVMKNGKNTARGRVRHEESMGEVFNTDSNHECGKKVTCLGK